MSVTPVASLIDLLREAEILKASQQTALAEMAGQHPDPETLAQHLVSINWLTAYQKNQLVEHAGKDLTIDRYILLEVLGEGGMGKVFKARPRGLDDYIVALKVIRQEHLNQDTEAVQRFQREARAAAQLAHPNIVMVRDFGQDGDTYFMAMEYLNGIDLARLVHTQGPLPVGQACDFIRQAALGLQHAHEHGMVHRDIKPSNLMATWGGRMPAATPQSQLSTGASGRETLRIQTGGSPPSTGTFKTVVKILDMGLVRVTHTGNDASASLTQEGLVIGTPDFIAPEQALCAHRVDSRADLYSLGGTFYYVLTGSPPFPEGTPLEKLLKHQLDEPRPVEQLRPEVGPQVAAVIRKLLAKRPMDRYQTPAEVAEVLTPLSRADAVPDRPATADLVETIPVCGPATPPVHIVPQPAEALLAASVFHWRDPAEADGALGQRAKKIAVCEGHPSCVMCVAFAPDGRTMASGDVDGSVRLWEFSHKRPPTRAVLRVKSRGVHALAFSPDGRLLVAGSVDGPVWVWNLKDESSVIHVSALQGHQGSVDAFAFSADGRFLASGGSDQMVRIWEWSNGDWRSRAVLKGQGGAVKGLAFAVDNQTLASAGADGTVRLWSMGRLWFKERAVVQGHRGQVNAVSFAPDGSALASGGQDRTVRLWNATAPAEATKLEGHANVVRALQFTPDGQTLVSAGDGREVIEWHAKTGAKRQCWMLSEALITSFAFTADGRYVAGGLSQGPVVVYRLVESTRG
jgi:eukaryotic-like serine/threonine-protein kinase